MTWRHEDSGCDRAYRLHLSPFFGSKSLPSPDLGSAQEWVKLPCHVTSMCSELGDRKMPRRSHGHVAELELPVSANGVGLLAEEFKRRMDVAAAALVSR